MTFWLVVIAIILFLILGALERGNTLKTARFEADEERHEIEQLAEAEQREYDAFFAVNEYPHRNDGPRVAVWAAKRGRSFQEAREQLLEAEMHDDISRALDQSRVQRLVDIQRGGWEVQYVALAFTQEQRRGEEFRPIHGMLWKPKGERYFLNLTDMSEFAKSGCDPSFPLELRSILQSSFTIEKEQRYEWDDKKNRLCLVDIDKIASA